MGLHSSEVKTHQLLLSFLTTEVPQLLLITLECCLHTPAASRPPRACPGKDLLSPWSLSPAPSSQNSPSYKKHDLHRVPQVRSPEPGTGAGGRGLPPDCCQDLTRTPERSIYFTSSHSEQICEKLRNSQGGSVSTRGAVVTWGCSRTLGHVVLRRGYPV